MRKEVRPIAGFPGYYVSNYGEVFSKWTGSGSGAHVGVVLRPLKLMRASGRTVVGLSRGGKRHVIRVHRLVLTAFIGPCPPGMQACHFPDRDTSNNRLDNLRWDTPSSNQTDRIAHGTSNRGERNGSAKLTRREVRAIRRERRDGGTYAAIANRYGVSLSAIQQIVERRTWKWL